MFHLKIRYVIQSNLYNLFLKVLRNELKDKTIKEQYKKYIHRKENAMFFITHTTHNYDEKSVKRAIINGNTFDAHTLCNIIPNCDMFNIMLMLDNLAELIAPFGNRVNAEKMRYMAAIGNGVSLADMEELEMELDYKNWVKYKIIDADISSFGEKDPAVLEKLCKERAKWENEYARLCEYLHEFYEVDDRYDHETIEVRFFPQP